MTWRVPLLVVLAAASSIGAAPQNRPVRSDQEILIQLERDWDFAFHHNDVAFIEKVLADEFVATYGDGRRGDRATELALARDFNQQVDSSTLDEFIVKEYGNTAVVWFTQRQVGPSKGQRIEVTYRYLDVFVQRDGRWQCVATQSTRVM